MRAQYYAHSLEQRPTAEWEPLEIHLRLVAALARDFAASFGAAEWGELAGLWHDLGKYREDFQRRLEGEQIDAPHAGAGAALGRREVVGDGRAPDILNTGPTCCQRISLPAARDLELRRGGAKSGEATETWQDRGGVRSHLKQFSLRHQEWNRLGAVAWLACFEKRSGCNRQQSFGMVTPA